MGYSWLAAVRNAAGRCTCAANTRIVRPTERNYSSTPKNVWVKRFPVWLILVVVFDATLFVAFRATMSPSPALTMEDQTPLAEASMEPTLTPCEVAVTKYVADGSPSSPNAAELHSIQEALCRSSQDDETLSGLTREFR